MSENKKIGLFWGDKAIYCVETLGTQSNHLFSIPIPPETDEATAEIQSPLVNLIKDAFSHQDIDANVINLSLSPKDVIFRSFMIPWMQSNEIKGVVDFEISKYIPFPMDELSFSYYPIIVNIDDTKKIRIVCVAIKKDTLTNYNLILEQAGLQVGIIEPATLSLIRTLKLSEFIPDKGTIALVEQDEEAGKIMIVDDGIPQFVREFLIRVQTESDEPIDPTALTTRLINEIRISLDYFSRQDNTLQVKQINLLTNKDAVDLAKSIEEDLGMPVKPLSGSSILTSADGDELCFLNAYGVGLIDEVNLRANFDLSGNKPKAVTLSSITSKKNINYKPVIITFAVCLAILLLSFGYSRSALSRQTKQLAKLKSQIGDLQFIKINEITKQSAELKDQFKHYGNIRLETEVGMFLNILPELLPETVWLDKLHIRYENLIQPVKSKSSYKIKLAKGTLIESTPILTIEGYAYVEEKKAQFSIISNFVNDLLKSEKFFSFFKKIDLETVRVEKIGDYDATYFKIMCK